MRAFHQKNSGAADPLSATSGDTRSGQTKGTGMGFFVSRRAGQRGGLDGEAGDAGKLQCTLNPSQVLAPVADGRGQRRARQPRGQGTARTCQGGAQGTEKMNERVRRGRGFCSSPEM